MSASSSLPFNITVSGTYVLTGNLTSPLTTYGLGAINISTPVAGAVVLDIAWHGIRLNEPGWHDGMAQFLAFTIAGLNAREGDLHVMLNMADVGTDAPLPPMPGRDWYMVVDTQTA